MTPDIHVGDIIHFDVAKRKMNPLTQCPAKTRVRFSMRVDAKEPDRIKLAPWQNCETWPPEGIHVGAEHFARVYAPAIDVVEPPDPHRKDALCQRQ